MATAGLTGEADSAQVKMDKKKPTTLRSGLNPIHRDLEETGVTIAAPRLQIRFIFPITDIRILYNARSSLLCIYAIRSEKIILAAAACLPASLEPDFFNCARIILQFNYRVILHCNRFRSTIVPRINIVFLALICNKIN